MPTPFYRTLTAMLAAALLSAAPVQARPATSITNLPSAVRRMMERAIQIAPHVHMFNAPLSASGATPLANEMLIEQTGGLILVDAGKSRGAGQRIVALIRSVSNKPLRAVVLTHWHQDHVLGLGPMVEAWPHVAIVTNTRTANAMATDPSYEGAPHGPGETATRDLARASTLRGYAEQFRTHLTDATTTAGERRGWADVVGVIDQRIADEQGTYLVAPTITFESSYSFPDTSAPVEVRTIGPGHTDGDLIVWLPRQRIAAAGDLLVAPIPFGGSHMPEWPETLRALKALQPRAIVPGHGPLQRGTRYLDRSIVLLTTFRGEADRLLALGPLNDEEIQTRADVSTQVRLFAGHDEWLRSEAVEDFPRYVALTYRQLEARRTQGGSQ